MSNLNTKVQSAQTIQTTTHEEEPCIKIWQSHLMICDSSRQPTCAAAILDLFERHSLAMIDQNNTSGWVTLSYDDIYFELFETFWLNNIKHHVRWLVDRGYLERDDETDFDEFGTYAYRFVGETVADSINRVGNNVA